MGLGEKIVALRKKSNMTQAELGEALCVTYQAVSKWERGESQPDFDTISKMAKFFGVPLSYFENGAEDAETQPSDRETRQSSEPTIIGMCVQCGRVLHDGEAAQTEPRLLCKSCVQNNELEKEQRARQAEDAALAAQKAERHKINMARSALRKSRNRALLIAIVPAAAVLILFSVLGAINSPDFWLIFGGGCVLTVFAYTFTAQMIWDGVVRDVCLGGGHVMSLPGVIFSLSPDGLLFLIAAKLFLGFIAAIVFVGSIVVCILAAISISPITFIPSLFAHNHEIRTAT